MLVAAVLSLHYWYRGGIESGSAFVLYAGKIVRLHHAAQRLVNAYKRRLDFVNVCLEVEGVAWVG